jgi:hypothetical protein
MEEVVEDLRLSEDLLYFLSACEVVLYRRALDSGAPFHQESRLPGSLLNVVARVIPRST